MAASGGCGACIGLLVELWAIILRHLASSIQSLPTSFVMQCLWSSGRPLASPGVRGLGSGEHLVLRQEVKSCSALPAHRQPWALAVWATNMSRVQRLPARCFLEEAPGMHVQRNAAGAGLQVW